MTTDQEIKTELAAALHFAGRGNIDAANQHWKTYIGLLELQMGRTGSIEHLTFKPSRECKTFPDCEGVGRCLNNCHPTTAPQPEK